jgi:hypothetical protein
MKSPNQSEIVMVLIDDPKARNNILTLWDYFSPDQQAMMWAVIKAQAGSILLQLGKEAKWP